MNKPDKWLLIEVNNGEYFKVFATWAGGYIDGDYWRLNSGVVSVEEDSDYYLFKGYSGSVYKCHKKAYGVMTSWCESQLSTIIEKNPNVKVIEEMPEDILTMEWER